MGEVQSNERLSLSATVFSVGRKVIDGGTQITEQTLRTLFDLPCDSQVFLGNLEIFDHRHLRVFMCQAVQPCSASTMSFPLASWFKFPSVKK